ncbi:MAG: hypothetical protein OEX02_20700, partial [Cyclobacteriaceae bacterium]|nr:hypothetical protein [Cyclobacteriaceae bacterium]
MNFHSVFQILRNKKKIVPVFITILLSFLVLSFITNFTWSSFVGSVRPIFSINYDNVYEVEIAWSKEAKDDSLLLISLKKQLYEQVQHHSQVSALTYSYASLINKSWGMGKIEEFDDILVMNVGNNFTEFFGLPLLKGRNFNMEDKSGPIPQAIVFRSFAEQREISFDENATPLVITRQRHFPDEDPEKKVRVIGIIEDFPFLDEHDRIETIMFIHHLKNKWYITGEKLYIRTKEQISKKELIEMLNSAVKKIGAIEHVSLSQVRSYETIMEQQFQTYLDYTKIFPALITVLLIYIGATLFGVFYQYVLNRRDEYAVRRSFGCTRWSIYRKVMLEALIYTLPGLLAGAVIFFN